MGEEEEVQRWWSGWAKRHNKKVRARIREQQLQSLNNCLTECLSALEKDVSEDPETAKFAERLSEMQKQVDVISEDTKAETVQQKTSLAKGPDTLGSFFKGFFKDLLVTLTYMLIFHWFMKRTD